MSNSLNYLILAILALSLTCLQHWLCTIFSPLIHIPLSVSFFFSFTLSHSLSHSPYHSFSSPISLPSSFLSFPSLCVLTSLPSPYLSHLLLSPSPLLPPLLFLIPIRLSSVTPPSSIFAPFLFLSHSMSLCICHSLSCLSV